MVSDMLKYLRCSVAVAVLVGVSLSTPAMAQSASELAVRLSQMEEQMRSLVGEVEQLTFEIKQLKAKAGNTDTGVMDSAPVQPAEPKKLAAQEMRSRAMLGQIDAMEQARAHATQAVLELPSDVDRDTTGVFSITLAEDPPYTATSLLFRLSVDDRGHCYPSVPSGGERDGLIHSALIG